jgi:WD40 repeat protein/tRNA A-37 threonylcarbamoyl transferase component Bud32
MPLQLGDTILNGKYRVISLAGEGGMARVWLAEELTFGRRKVALKEPRADLSSSLAQEIEERYQREVQVCAALEQAGVPNIVRALTAEPHDKGLLLVMEYMPGGDLAAQLKEHPGGLPLEQAVTITLDLLRALEGVHAHELEIVHRDIKPSNVLFGDEGRAHLADFGLTQLAGVSGRSQLQGGQHPGTPIYMAPEQEAGSRMLTSAADLYAVGCVLFEMLTGQRYKRHQLGTAPSALRPEVPGWLDEIVARALAEEPWERWQRAGEMAAALESGRVREQERRKWTQDSERRPSLWYWGVVGLALLTLVVGLVVVVQSRFMGSLTPTAMVTLPVLVGTPIPMRLAPITAEDAESVTQLARWGKGQVRHVIYSPDGALLAVASSIGIYLYDTQTWSEVRFIETHAQRWQLAFDPAGAILASAMDGNAIQLWRVRDGSLIRTIGGDNGPSIWSIEFSPDGHMLVSETDDNTTWLWHVDDGNLIRTLEGHSAHFSPDGTMLVTVSGDAVFGTGSVAYTSYVWRVSDGSLVSTMGGHSPRFSPDGTILVTSSDDESVHMWQVRDGSLLRTLEGHDAAFSPDGTVLAIDSGAETLNLWRASDGQLLYTLEGYSSSLRSFAFSPDGAMVALASWSRVQLWRVSDGSSLHQLKGNTAPGSSLVFSADGAMLASDSEREVKIWQVSNGGLVRTLEHTVQLNTVALSPDGQIVALGMDDSTVWLRNANDGTLLRALEGHAGWVFAVAFSPDGSMLASGSDDDTVRLWRVSDGSLLHIFEGTTPATKSLAFSPDGTVLAVGSYEKTRLWRLTDGRLLHTLEHPDSTYVQSLAFSPDGTMLATANRSADAIRLWRVSDGSLVTTWEVHAHFVDSLAFSPDGMILASVVGDDVQLWRVSDATHLRTLTGHKSTIRRVVFGPDGTMLATGSLDDDTIRLWRTSDGGLLRTLSGHTDGITDVGFGHDGRLLVSGSVDGTVRLWGIGRW